MAGNINLFEKYSKGVDNEQFHLEMCTVASNENFISQKEYHEEGYIQADMNSQGSVLSLKERSDMHPLTQWHSCQYEECKKFHSPVHADPESPASPLKNAFFYLVIVLLVLWVLVYAILNRMNYL